MLLLLKVTPSSGLTEATHVNSAVGTFKVRYLCIKRVFEITICPLMLATAAFLRSCRSAAAPAAAGVVSLVLSYQLTYFLRRPLLFTSLREDVEYSGRTGETDITRRSRSPHRGKNLSTRSRRVRLSGRSLRRSAL